MSKVKDKCTSLSVQITISEFHLNKMYLNGGKAHMTHIKYDINFPLASEPAIYISLQTHINHARECRPLK